MLDDDRQVTDEISGLAEPSRYAPTVYRYSTVTLLARLRGWSTLAPRLTAM